MAKLNAEKNIMSLILHRGNSIGSDINYRYKKSYVRMKACRTGESLSLSLSLSLSSLSLSLSLSLSPLSSLSPRTVPSINANSLGWGTNAGWDMKIVLDSFGITDVSANLGGSRNKATRYRAIFMGLMKGVRTKEEVSRILGRKLFNKQKLWYNGTE
jgi:ribosomal protein S5